MIFYNFIANTCETLNWVDICENILQLTILESHKDFNIPHA